MISRALIVVSSAVVLGMLIFGLVSVLRSDAPVSDPDEGPSIDPVILAASIDALTVLYHEYWIPLRENYSLVEDQEMDPVLCVDLGSQPHCIEGLYRRELTVDVAGTERTMGLLYANASAIEAFMRLSEELDPIAYHVIEEPGLIARSQPPEYLDRFVWVRASADGELMEPDSIVSHTVLTRHAELDPVLFYVFEEDRYVIDRQLTVFGSPVSEHVPTLERFELDLA